ncbi:MAG: hypothetical protein ACKVP0_00960 [Pirellulaceae bacterium]
MSRIIVKSKVGSDGVLQLTLPLGPGEANQEVSVTIESAAAAPLSQEEWKRRILATAGSIPDPTFIRHDPTKDLATNSPAGIIP